MSTSFRSASQNSSVSTDDRMETGSQVVKSPPVTVTQSYGIMLPPVTVMQQQQQQRISTSQAAYGENRVSYSPFAPADQQLSNFPEAHVRIVKDEKGGTHQVLTRTLIDPGQASGLSPAQFQKFQSAAFASQEGLNSVKRERGEIDEKGMSPMSIVSYQDSSQPSPSSSSQPRTQGLRYQASGNPGDAMLSAINYNDTDMLHDGGFDVSMTTNLSNLEEGLLGNMASGANVRLTENPTTGTFDLFDGDGNVAEPYSMESLSPQAFHDNNPGFPIAEGGALGTVGDSDHSGGHVEGRSNTASPVSGSGKGRNKGRSSKAGSPGRSTGVQCPICAKGFSNSSALAKHKLTHSDERKYSCHICSKAFKRQDHLNGHMMTHRDKKPFECMVKGCEKSYCDARSLKRHMENHHNQPGSEASLPSQLIAAVSQAVAQNQPQLTNSLGEVPGAPLGGEAVYAGGTGGGESVGLAETGLGGGGGTRVHFTASHTPYSPSPASTPHQSPGYANSQPHNYFQFESQQQQQQQQQQVPPPALPPPPPPPPQTHFQTTSSGQVWPQEAGVVFVSQNSHSPRSGEQSPGYLQQISPISPAPTSPRHTSQPRAPWGQLGYSQPQTTDLLLKPGEENKPVQCSMCNRRFKNIPALNGHMRLHGGYFKKVVNKDNKEDKKKVKKPDLAAPSLGHIVLPGKVDGDSGQFKQPFQASAADQQNLQSPVQGGTFVLPMAVGETGGEPQSPLTPTHPHPLGSPLQGGASTEQASQQHHRHVQQLLQQHIQMQSLQQLQHQQQKIEQKQHQLQQLQEQLQQHFQHQTGSGLDSPTSPNHLGVPSSPAGLAQRSWHTPDVTVSVQVASSPSAHGQDSRVWQDFTPHQEAVFQQQLQTTLDMEKQLQHQHQIEQQLQQHQQQQQQQHHVEQQLHQQHLQHHQVEQQLQQHQVEQHLQQQQQKIEQQLQQQQQLEQQLQQHKLEQQLQQQNQHQQDAAVTNVVTMAGGSPQQPYPILQQHLMLGLQPSGEAIQSPVDHMTLPTTFSDVLPQAVPSEALSSTLPNSMGTTDVLTQPVFVSAAPISGSQPFIGGDRQQDLTDAQLLTSVVASIISGHHSLPPIDQPQSQFANSGADGQHTGLTGAHHNIQLADLQHVQLPTTTMSYEGRLTENSTDPIMVNNSLQPATSLADQLSLASDSAFVSHPQPDSASSIKSDEDKLFPSQLHLHTKTTAEISPFTFRPVNSQGNHHVDGEDRSNSVHGKLTIDRDKYLPIPSVGSSAFTHSERGLKSASRKRHKSEGVISSLAKRTVSGNLSVLLQKGDNQSHGHKPTNPQSAQPDGEARVAKAAEEKNKLLQRSKSEDHTFMRPQNRLEDPFYRPRSRTEDTILHRSRTHHDFLSRSDGAGIFRNPSLPISPLRAKKKHRPAPLIIPAHVNNCGFQSRLRSPRLWDGGGDGRLKRGTTPPPYTPPPMLSPVRSGSGLFWTLPPRFKPMTPKSAPIAPRLTLCRRASLASAALIKGETIEEEPENEEDREEAPPETDIQPHVNVGPQYQADIPRFSRDRSAVFSVPGKEDLIWEPSIISDTCAEEDVQSYQEFACSAAVQGNGANVEFALHLLYLTQGDIQEAMLLLMRESLRLPEGHPLLSFQYQEADVWNTSEIEAYYQALLKCDKDFFLIAKEVEKKTVKECIQFYYLWKKVCPDEYKRLRVVRRKKEHDELYNLRSRGATTTLPAEQPSLAAEGGSESDSTSEEEGEDNSVSQNEVLSSRDQGAPLDQSTSPARSVTPPRTTPSPASVFTCEITDCTATFTSKQALNSHAKLHGALSGHSYATTALTVSREAARHQPVSRVITTVTGVNAVFTTVSPAKPRRQVSTVKKPAVPQAPVLNPDGSVQIFPCKLCGKVFYKVKSRSAHMKSHREVDRNKPRPQPVARLQPPASLGT